MLTKNAYLGKCKPIQYRQPWFVDPVMSIAKFSYHIQNSKKLFVYYKTISKESPNFPNDSQRNNSAMKSYLNFTNSEHFLIYNY